MYDITYLLGIPPIDNVTRDIGSTPFTSPAAAEPQLSDYWQLDWSEGGWGGDFSIGFEINQNIDIIPALANSKEEEIYDRYEMPGGSGKPSSEFGNLGAGFDAPLNFTPWEAAVGTADVLKDPAIAYLIWESPLIGLGLPITLAKEAEARLEEFSRRHGIMPLPAS